jgi:IS1 family transposase
MLQEQRRTGVGYLEKSLLPARKGDVLELDEVWSFVLKKSQQVWIWLALCRRTRQIVAWMPGPRDHITLRQLWDRIPASYKAATCFTDFWESYAQVIPQEQHRSCAKQEGETNHIERFNLTLRQSVARLVRKTLSFSKQHLWHYRAIRNFLVYYNNRKAKQYLSRGTSY